MSDSDRTRYMARAVGPFLIVMALAIFARYETLPLLIPAFFQDGTLVFVTGAFTLMVGLAMLAAHHHWTGWDGSIITLLSIIVCVRGAVLLVAPQIAASLVSGFVLVPPVALIASAAILFLGAWFTYLGWLTKG